MRSPLWLIGAISVTLLAPSTPAHAQAKLYGEDVADPAARHFVVLSISGGVSLGSYQAGVNWAILNLYRHARSDPRLNLPAVELASIAGASAGNINSILWAIEGCSNPPVAPPEESLFWKTWVSVGLSQLLPVGVPLDSTEHALFDRRFFRSDLYGEIRKNLVSAHLQPECSVRAGVTLTRIRPDTLTLGALSVPTQRFAAVFSTRVVPGAAGGARTLRFEWPTEDSLLTSNRRFGKLVLPPRRADGSVSDTTIFDIAEASSSFPVAFQPKFIRLYDPDAGVRDTVSEWYADGGVFDNNPVGLSLELFAHAFRERLNDTSPDTVTVLYVNPGRLRHPLDSLRLAKLEGLASGGLMAASQLLEGAIATARQYEMQLWLRDPTVTAPDTVHVLLTSRAHPIMGEHLGHFAAFLARPFREYDFYVGVYDGMHLLTRQYACGDSLPAAQPGCIARTMQSLIARPPIELGAVAPSVLQALLARELGGDAPGVANGNGSHDGEAVSPADSLRRVVLLALHAAQETQYRTTFDDCGGSRLPRLLLCGRGLLALLDAFREVDAVGHAAQTWLEECERATPESDCREAESFRDLVDDPLRYTGETIDYLLARLRRTEHRLHEEAEDSSYVDPRGRSAGERMDAELLTVMLESVYRSQPLRPRYGFEWSGTSASSGRAHVLPYHVGAGLGTSGFEIGYRPTYQFRHGRIALTFPATLHWRGMRMWTPADPNELKIINYVGGGAGVAFRGVFPPTFNALVPEFGASVQELWGLTDRYGGGFPLYEVYAEFPLLIGRIRLAGRYTPAEDRLFNGGKNGAFASLADFNGYMYWLYSAVRDLF